MSPRTWLLLTSALLVSIAMSSQEKPKAGPFGLSPWMTRAEIIKLIGPSAVVEELGGSIIIRDVPLKSAYFDNYMCSFDENGKLRSILASSKPLRTKDGEDLRESFDNLKSMLEGKYGKLLAVTGGGRSHITWADSIESGHPFMQGLWDDWYFRPPSPIREIVLYITAYKDYGYIKLEYDFKNDYMY